MDAGLIRGFLQPRGRFSLDRTLSSGQVFTWRRSGDAWLGCVRGELVLLYPGDRLRFVSTGLDGDFLASYLGLHHRMADVGRVLSRDRWGRVAFRERLGLRLLSQDPWDCLLSFALATNTSVQGATRMMNGLRARFGRRLAIQGHREWAIPQAGDLARASIGELRACGLGYRAHHIRGIANAVVEGLIDLASLGRLGYRRARQHILQLSEAGVLPGVGRKVADCLLLYSYGLQESVPVDRWMARATLELYGEELEPRVRLMLRRALQRSSSLPPGLYEQLASFLRRRFAPYSGYAQLYLYSWFRPPGQRAAPRSGRPLPGAGGRPGSP